MKIKINTNCRNGEHVFIPANTYVDGRENIVIKWVCQHCLFTVGAKSQWEEPDLEELAVTQNQVEEFEMDKFKGAQEEPVTLKNIELETPKKRGPKPKGEIKGLLHV